MIENVLLLSLCFFKICGTLISCLLTFFEMPGNQGDSLKNRIGCSKSFKYAVYEYLGQE